MEKVKRSRVNAYVKAVLLRDKLAKKLANAQAEVTVREGGLNGGQMAEANRILNGIDDSTIIDEGGES